LNPPKSFWQEVEPFDEGTREGISFYAVYWDGQLITASSINPNNYPSQITTGGSTYVRRSQRDTHYSNDGILTTWFEIEKL